MFISAFHNQLSAGRSQALLTNQLHQDEQIMV